MTDNTLYLTVIDGTTNKPITQGVCISGRWDSSPCPTFSTGCTSGPGQGVQLATDSNGSATWSFPYTCAGQFTLLFQTPNYQDLSVQFANGSITGPVYKTISMYGGTAFQKAQEPPQCMGMWADLSHASQTTSQSVSDTASGAANFAQNLGLYAVIGLAIAFALVIALIFVFGVKV